MEFLASAMHPKPLHVLDADLIIDTVGPEVLCLHGYICRSSC